MKFWDKIKTWNYKRTHKVCPWCNEEKDNIEFVCEWLPDNQCSACHWKEKDRLLQERKAREIERKARDREARIEEMAEAIRRASPVGVSIISIK